MRRHAFGEALDLASLAALECVPENALCAPSHLRRRPRSVCDVCDGQTIGHLMRTLSLKIFFEPPPIRPGSTLASQLTSRAVSLRAGAQQEAGVPFEPSRSSLVESGAPQFGDDFPGEMVPRSRSNTCAR